MKRFYLASILLVTVALPIHAADVWTTLFSENLLDAKDGDADAQYEVGIMYLKGQGVSANRDKAIKWLKTAADNDSDLAVGKLSRMEGNVQTFSVTQKKAKRGDAEAQYVAGRMLIGGKGTKIDAQAATAWLQKAAKQGHKKAATQLGIIYYKGDGVPSNPELAVDLFNQVASSQVLAQYYLGEAFADGRGVPRNYDTAINWYQQADKNGYKRAGGKIINLQEEVKMQQRREARLAREQQLAAKSSKQADRARRQAAQKKRERDIRAAEVKLAKIRAANKSAKPVVMAVAKSIPKQDIKYLAKKNWDSKGKSISFLPSELNQCEEEGGRLVCYSHKIRESSVGRTIKYRVKSIITPGETEYSFHVIYRNLVLDVVLQEQEETLAYGDEQAQGFKVKTGWSKQHKVECKFDSASNISCLKDGVHRVKVAIANGGRDRDNNKVAASSQ